MVENTLLNRLNISIGAIRKNGKPIKQKQIAIDLGYSRESTVSEIVNGKRDMSPKFIKAFCATYGIDETWLLTGKGQMMIKEPSHYHAGSELKKYLEQNGYNLGMVAGMLNTSVQEVKNQLEKHYIDFDFLKSLSNKLIIPRGILFDIDDPKRTQTTHYWEEDRNPHWGNEVKSWIECFGESYQYISDTTDYSIEEIHAFLSMPILPETFVEKLLYAYPEIAMGRRRISANFPVPPNFQFETTRHTGSAEYWDFDHVHLKYFPRDLQSLYNKKLVNTLNADARLIDLAPDFLVPDPYPNNLGYKKMEYMVFEMNGNHMDDGTQRSILDGDKLLGVEINSRKFKFLIEKEGLVFILITSEGPMFTEITNLDTQKKVLVCHSRNPKYQDFSLKISDIKQFFCVLKIVEREIAPGIEL